MARKAVAVAEGLRRRARALDRYLRRLERFNSDGDLPQAELKYAYAGAFVTFHSAAEGSIEDLFMGLLMDRITPPRQSIRALISVESEVVARRVVLGDRSYVDWLPYNRTKKRALAYFSSGEPFRSLEKTHRKSLERASIMRNAIAHQSGSAQKRFFEEFVEGKNLPPAETKPTGYLRGLHAPNQRRINLLFAEVVAAIEALCS